MTVTHFGHLSPTPATHCISHAEKNRLYIYAAAPKISLALHTHTLIHTCKQGRSGRRGDREFSDRLVVAPLPVRICHSCLSSKLEGPVDGTKVCSSKLDAAFTCSPPTEFVVRCTIIHKPHVVSHRHLTEGTGASEAGLKPQRSMRHNQTLTIG